MNVYLSNPDTFKHVKTKLPVGGKALWKTKYNLYVGGIVQRLFLNIYVIPLKIFALNSGD